MLTRDSPIHQAKISADGNYAAYGAESDERANPPEVPAPPRKSFRALSITPTAAPNSRSQEQTSGVCGNSTCEPDFGETRENCAPCFLV